MPRYDREPSMAFRTLAVTQIFVTLLLWTINVQNAHVTGSVKTDPLMAGFFMFSVVGLIVTGHRIVPRSQNLGITCLTIGYGILAIGSIVPGCR